MLITVTCEDIDKARRDLRGCSTRPWCCPIAQAYYRITRRSAAVCHDGNRDEMYIGHPGRMLPRAAIQFVNAFDEGREVQPISFHVAD